jgi:hypothetical protein
MLSRVLPLMRRATYVASVQLPPWIYLSQQTTGFDTPYQVEGRLCISLSVAQVFSALGQIGEHANQERCQPHKGLFVLKLDERGYDAANKQRRDLMDSGIQLASNPVTPEHPFVSNDGSLPHQN